MARALQGNEQHNTSVDIDMSNSPATIFDTDIDWAAEIAEADAFAEHQRREAGDNWAERHADHLWRTR